MIVTFYFTLNSGSQKVNPTRGQYSRLSRVWPPIGSCAMITACMGDWSAHVNVYMVYGRCVNADRRYQDKKRHFWLLGQTKPGKNWVHVPTEL